jgi:hypothetical protein
MPNEFIIKNGFRSQGNSEVTGSLSILESGINSLNTATYTLRGANASSSLDWNSRRLSDSAGERSILWGSRLAYDSLVVPSINWDTRALVDSLSISSVNWGTRTTYDHNETPSIDWDGRFMYDATNLTSTDWANRFLVDSNSANAVDWENKQLTDYTGESIIVWGAANNRNKIIQYKYVNTEISTDNQENFLITAINDNRQNSAGELITVGDKIDPAVLPGDLVSLDAEDGIWKQTDQTSARSSYMLGICIDPYDKGAIFTEGTITVVTDTGFTDIPFVEGTSFYGKPVYMRSGSLAGLSTTIPTSGYVRVVGHIYYNSEEDSKYWLMKFRPSNDWYVI